MKRKIVKTRTLAQLEKLLPNDKQQDILDELGDWTDRARHVIDTVLDDLNNDGHDILRRLKKSKLKYPDQNAVFPTRLWLEGFVEFENTISEAEDFLESFNELTDEIEKARRIAKRKAIKK